ncbi:BRO-N domain-containing protein [Mycobacteroides abscessus]|uniref:BRO-N domain-containing protein n=1 Tax=Mycobacteroides abscessus TaxID=36809 RepID=UPI000C259FBF|nr:BRO family protein [Mycobacteroides abscessus]
MPESSGTPTSNTSSIELFNFHHHSVRVVVIGGEPWFVLADLCKVLGILSSSAVTDVKKRLDQGTLDSTKVMNSAGYMRETDIVSEAGMYEVVIRSDKPEAVEFRRFVTGTVLPQIRRTGSYGTPTLPSPRELAQMVIAAEDRADAEHALREKAEKKLEVEQRHRRAIEGGDGIDPTTFGKKYFSEVPARKFDEHLYSHDYLINQRNSRVRADGSIADGYDHRKPTAKGRKYFYPHDGGTYNGRRRFTARVRPQMEIALRDALASEGLPVNEHSTGLILLTREDIKELGA